MTKFVVKTTVDNIKKDKDGEFTYEEEIVSMHIGKKTESDADSSTSLRDATDRELYGAIVDIFKDMENKLAGKKLLKHKLKKKKKSVPKDDS